jgi:hypothetical protein
MKKIIVLGILLALMVGLAACGGDDGNSEDASSSSTSSSTSLNTSYGDALPVESQLVVGTLMLEETENALTVEQAGELLPVWQMLQALQSSGTAAPAEVEAVLDQIQRAMTDEQLAVIKEMKLTADSMTEMFQERGGMGGGFAGMAGGQGGGGFQPPAGMMPGGGAGGGMGGGFGPGGLGGGNQDLSPEEQEAAMAERIGRFAGTAMTGMLVSLLEARAEGQEWQVAAPNQEVMLQNTLYGVIVEATGLEQQEVRTQTREGKTLQEVAEANGADVNQILAQVIAAEAERVNQAVADGSLEQAEAEQYLADLETLAQEMLQGTFQFGNRAGDTPAQP